MDRQDDARQASGPSHSMLVTHATHANPAFGCEMYRCPPTCQYAGPDRSPAGMKQENGDEQRANVSEKREREVDPYENNQPVATLRQPDRGWREDHRNAGLGPAEGLMGRRIAIHAAKAIERPTCAAGTVMTGSPPP